MASPPILVDRTLSLESCQSQNTHYFADSKAGYVGSSPSHLNEKKTDVAGALPTRSRGSHKIEEIYKFHEILRLVAKDGDATFPPAQNTAIAEKEIVGHDPAHSSCSFRSFRDLQFLSSFDVLIRVVGAVKLQHFTYDLRDTTHDTKTTSDRPGLVGPVIMLVHTEQPSLLRRFLPFRTSLPQVDAFEQHPPMSHMPV